MNCLRSLERWDRGICVRVYSVLVLSCVQAEVLRRAKESYRLCKNDCETEEEAKAQQMTVESLMSE
jgi:hypothetical protein